LTAQEIEDVLSPSSLRSTLFTITPLYRGKRLMRLILWGAGTGTGRGVCRGGALGMASLGQGYHDILTHYYPGAHFEGLKNVPAPKTEEPAPKAPQKKGSSKKAAPKKPAAKKKTP
jgi:peptidoglycan hydrolase-like amidase